MFLELTFFEDLKKCPFMVNYALFLRKITLPVMSLLHHHDVVDYHL